jgi:ATP-dependent Clp protease ATP-binding subunit ClpC
MFEGFTEQARRAVEDFAEDEARARSHDWIGTEHLLLGVLHDEDEVAARTLQSLDISPESTRQQVDQIMEEAIGQVQRTQPVDHLPFTPRSKRVLELSAVEAGQLAHDHVTTGHVLLALIREVDGLAGQVLVNLEAHLTAARERVTELLSGDEPGD